ncbi:MAG: HupE/UreJ family protein [Enhydrobacter sp.]|nr:MAG: HupE/UreJ family protein [Enhydrobacter sp.]
MLRIVGLSVALLFAGSPAMAHSGHAASGFAHPFTGIDHLLAMVGTGMWAAFLATKRPSAAYLVPLAFVTMMALGAAAGFAGTKLPFVEAGIVASVFLVGGLAAAAVRLPVNIAMIVVGLFAILHGYAHALEAPGSDTGRYVLGFLLATAALHAIGLGLGMAAQRLVGDFGMRTLGGLIVAGGAFILAAH